MPITRYFNDYLQRMYCFACFILNILLLLIIYYIIIYIIYLLLCIIICICVARVVWLLFLLLLVCCRSITLVFSELQQCDTRRVPPLLLLSMHLRRQHQRDLILLGIRQESFICTHASILWHLWAYKYQPPPPQHTAHLSSQMEGAGFFLCFVHTCVIVASLQHS